MSERDTPISPESSGGHRPTRVNLKADAGGPGAGLDAAHQSLADALRLVFRGLMAAMVILLVVFALSGVQQVKEGETGIKLLFGRKVAEELKPGPQFAAPFPFGELVKVVTAGPVTNLDESFWPKLDPSQRELSVEKVAQFGKPSLKPGEDGSHITADQNLAHTRWQVQYERSRPAEFKENIYEDDEAAIVRCAVERGIVHAMAETTVDDLMKQSSGDQASVARRAQAVAQAQLDRIKSGIRLTQVTLKDKSPPFPVFASFTGVQSAEQKAGEKVNGAISEASNRLNAAAGGAHAPLIAQIDAYEQAIALSDGPAQARIMESIRSLLDGRATEVKGVKWENAAAGQVTALLNEARQHRSSIVSQRRAELTMFQAKQEQFKLNPDLVVQRDWADAMSALLKRDTVEVFWVPPGMAQAEIWLNRDVIAQRSYEAALKRKQLKAREEQQRIEAERDAMKTRTDVQEMSLEPTLKTR